MWLSYMHVMFHEQPYCLKTATRCSHHATKFVGSSEKIRGKTSNRLLAAACCMWCHNQQPVDMFHDERFRWQQSPDVGLLVTVAKAAALLKGNAVTAPAAEAAAQSQLSRTPAVMT